MNRERRLVAELRKMAKRFDSKSNVSEFDSLARYARIRKKAKRTALEAVVCGFDSLFGYLWARGENGKHTGFKLQCRKAYGFESLCAYFIYAAME